MSTLLFLHHSLLFLKLQMCDSPIPICKQQRDVLLRLDVDGAEVDGVQELDKVNLGDVELPDAEAFEMPDSAPTVHRAFAIAGKGA